MDINDITNSLNVWINNLPYYFTHLKQDELYAWASIIIGILFVVAGIIIW